MLRINQYYRPTSVDDAVRELKEGVKILAGGTDLIIALRERHIQPEGLMDLSRVDELKRIYVDDGQLHIGSMATFHDIECNENVLRYCPVLAKAASEVGAPQIRARATVGGNVANAATAADSIPPLLAAGAQTVIASRRGTRKVPVADVLAGANKTTLAADELITKFMLPLNEGALMAFEKIGRRRALAIARINLALLLELSGGRIDRIAIAVGAVGKTAYRVHELENELQGKVLTPELVNQACERMDEIVARNLAGRSTTPYKRRIASAVLRRAFETMPGGVQA